MFYHREIYQTISHSKLRTALTGLSVSWGIFMLIVLVGMANGLVRDFESDSDSQATDNIALYGGVTSRGWHGYAEGRRIQLKGSDGPAMRSRSGGRVSDVTLVITNDTARVTCGSRSVSSGYTGAEPAVERTSRVDIAAGRFINAADMRDTRRVMVLSERTVGQLFGDGCEAADAIGREVTCMDLVFRVVGVYSSRWDETVYIPYTTARMLAGNSDDVGQITVSLDGVNSMADGEAAERNVVETLAVRHDFDPDDTGAVWTWNRFTQHLQIASGMSILGAVTWIIGILTLLTGIVGVSNIMFVSVRERTHEIGVRRAIGARPRQIVTQIILESVTITALFGYIGIVLGVGVLQLLDMAFGGMQGFPSPVVDLGVAFEVTLLLVIAGALAGLFPALKALKVKPVEALRTE